MLSEELQKILKESKKKARRRKIKRTILSPYYAVKSSILCLRFPFLYPRNRWTDKHYNNWKLYDYHKDNWDDAYEWNKFGINKKCPKINGRWEVKNKWMAFKIKCADLLNDFLGIFHCIPLYTELDAMPHGWRKCFGIQMCKEVKKALLEDGRKTLKRYRITQIKEKFGCYDTETEVLTKDGWKYFKDITYNDYIATLNKKDELEYHKPNDIINYHYNGKMYVLQNRGIDIKVTPNHNLYVSKGSYYNGSKNNEKREYDFELCSPDKYYGKDKRFKKGCIWIGKKPDKIFKIPDYVYTNLATSKNGKKYNRKYTIKGKEFEIIPFLRFLGFYVAEGYTKHNKNGSNIYIAYNLKDEEGLVNELLNSININVEKQKNNGLKRFSNAPLAAWLKENCGNLAENKKVPDFIKELEPEYIKEFLTYLFIGDGHKTETSNILTTVSKQLSDDVSELILKCGDSFRIYKERKRDKNTKIKHNFSTYEINWLKNNYVEIDNSKTKKIKNFKECWEDYDDFVYCVTVPNNIIYVRRNGKGYWCGNSLRWYDTGGNRQVQKVIAKYEYISYRTCIECGRPAEYVTNGWIEPYCERCIPENKKDYASKYESDMDFYGWTNSEYYEKHKNKKEETEE